MNNDSISDYIAHHENVLKTILNQATIPANRIREAIGYALFPGGKRLRPVLVYLCGELLDVNPACLDFIAAAIEITHCYSLVHDDLPAMDDDDLRRGKPSCHRAFDEATAILVGDGMQAMAIEVLLTHLNDKLSPEQIIAIALELVKASGPAGMVSGQSLDLSELAKPHINEAQLKQIHLLKTGKLILTCINMVLIASQQKTNRAKALQAFAYNLGLVFQMQDDYLDFYGHCKLLGKSRSSDTANNKLTFATLYDKYELKQLIAHYYQQANNDLNLFEQRSNKLRDYLNYLHQRTDFNES